MMTNISELDDNLLLKVSEDSILRMAKTMNHLQKVLLKDGKGSVSRLFQRVGLGLTSKQFDTLVRVLVDNGFCTVSVGERGAVTITVNKNYNTPEASEVA